MVVIEFAQWGSFVPRLDGTGAASELGRSLIESKSGGTPNVACFAQLVPCISQCNGVWVLKVEYRTVIPLWSHRIL